MLPKRHRAFSKHMYTGAPRRPTGPAPIPPQRHTGHPQDLPGMPHPGNSSEHWLVGTRTQWALSSARAVVHDSSWAGRTQAHTSPLQAHTAARPKNGVPAARADGRSRPPRTPLHNCACLSGSAGCDTKVACTGEAPRSSSRSLLAAQHSAKWRVPLVEQTSVQYLKRCPNIGR